MTAIERHFDKLVRSVRAIADEIEAERLTRRGEQVIHCPADNDLVVMVAGRPISKCSCDSQVEVALAAMRTAA